MANKIAAHHILNEPRKNSKLNGMSARKHTTRTELFNNVFEATQWLTEIKNEIEEAKKELTDMELMKRLHNKGQARIELRKRHEKISHWFIIEEEYDYD